MKIACVILSEFANLGGVEVFTFNFLTRLTDMGHECTLYLTKRAIRNIGASKRELPFRVASLGVERARPFRLLPSLMVAKVKWIQRKNKYQLWQIMGAYPAAVIASALEVPTVLRAHGDDIQHDDDLNYGVTRNPSVRAFVTNSLKSVDCLVAMTQAMEKSYRRLDVPSTRIRLIPNMVNTNRFTEDYGRDEVRRSLGFPGDEMVLVTVGRYHVKKGHDLIPAIAKELRSRVSNFKWLLVGKEVTRLAPEISRLGLENLFVLKETITFNHSVQESEFDLPSRKLIALMKAADIFVFPTRLEGFPMVIIEAMAAGLPIVTTNAPGVGELFEHERNAMLSPVDDIQALVGNIARVVREPSIRELLIENGKSEVSKYDIEIVVNRYLGLYAELLDEERAENFQSIGLHTTVESIN